MLDSNRLSSQRLLLVVYIEREKDVIRIIHARKAGPSQEKMYEENQSIKS
jgi:uncharacterized DUF497 family protein